MVNQDRRKRAWKHHQISARGHVPKLPRRPIDSRNQELQREVRTRVYDSTSCAAKIEEIGYLVLWCHWNREHLSFLKLPQRSEDRTVTLYTFLPLPATTAEQNVETRSQGATNEPSVGRAMMFENLGFNVPDSEDFDSPTFYNVKPRKPPPPLWNWSMFFHSQRPTPKVISGNVLTARVYIQMKID